LVVVAAVPVLVKVTVGFAEVLLLKPVVGDHEYVVPVVDAAPIVPEAPEHIEILAPAFDTGKGLIVATTAVVVLWHPIVHVA
jgi:hypothetical protein